MSTKDYRILWEEHNNLREGICYFISFEEGKIIEQVLDKNIVMMYFSNREEILKSSIDIEYATYMNLEEANIALNKLKECVIGRDMKIEYAGQGIKFTRFEIMDI